MELAKKIPWKWIDDGARRSLQSITLVMLVLTAPLVGFGGQPAQRSQSARQPTIGFVKSAKDFDEGGCELWPAADRTSREGRDLFLSDFAGRAVMNINGRDAALKLIEPKEPKGEPKKGESSTYRYRGAGVEVVVRYVVTGICAPDDESCEVTNYKALVTVTTASGTRALPAHGTCGS